MNADHLTNDQDVDAIRTLRGQVDGLNQLTFQMDGASGRAAGPRVRRRLGDPREFELINAMRGRASSYSPRPAAPVARLQELPRLNDVAHRVFMRIGLACTGRGKHHLGRRKRSR